MDMSADDWLANPTPLAEAKVHAQTGQNLLLFAYICLGVCALSFLLSFCSFCLSVFSLPVGLMDCFVVLLLAMWRSTDRNMA
jgi:hypothetical protein